MHRNVEENLIFVCYVRTTLLFLIRIKTISLLTNEKLLLTNRAKFDIHLYLQLYRLPSVNVTKRLFLLRAL